MGKIKDKLLIDNNMYAIGYFLIVRIVKDGDKAYYNLIDLLNDKNYTISENVNKDGVSNWLKRICLDNGIKYPNPTISFISEKHTKELYFHALTKSDAQTIKDVKIISMDNAKIFIEYDKLYELEQIDKKLGV